MTVAVVYSYLLSQKTVRVQIPLKILFCKQLHQQIMKPCLVRVVPNDIMDIYQLMSQKLEIDKWLCSNVYNSGKSSYQLRPVGNILIQ